MSEDTSKDKKLDTTPKAFLNLKKIGVSSSIILAKVAQLPHLIYGQNE